MILFTTSKSCLRRASFASPSPKWSYAFHSRRQVQVCVWHWSVWLKHRLLHNSCSSPFLPSHADTFILVLLTNVLRFFWLRCWRSLYFRPKINYLLPAFLPSPLYRWVYGVGPRCQFMCHAFNLSSLELESSMPTKWCGHRAKSTTTPTATLIPADTKHLYYGQILMKCREVFIKVAHKIAVRTLSENLQVE